MDNISNIGSKAKIAFWIGIGSLIIAVVGIIILGIKIASIKTIESSISQLNDIDKTLKSKYEELNSRIAVSSPIPGANRGPQGIKGPAGPAGPPGGLYSASGALMNMGFKKIATPTYGKGLPALVYLDEKHFSPVQYWYLENNPNGSVKIRNKYTDLCLTVNTTKDVYSDVCNNNNSNQQFSWEKNMQLKSKGMTNHCLDIGSWTRSDNDNPGFNYENLTTVPGSNSGNVDKLKIETCSASLNPKQTWYVGA